MSGELEWVLVGLGNPGADYRGTRHNVGFMLLDVLRDHAAGLNRITLKNSTAWEGELFGVRVVMARPKTYMNRSGLAVSELMRRWEFDDQRMLVILDEASLPLGRIRLREEGSPGGHNGLKSIRDELGGNDYPRLRIGVKEDERPDDMSDFVLSPFPKETWPQLGATLGASAAAVKSLVGDGLDKALAVYNGWRSLSEIRDKLSAELGEDLKLVEQRLFESEKGVSLEEYERLLAPKLPTDPSGREFLPDGSLYDADALTEAVRVAGQLQRLRGELIKERREQEKRLAAEQQQAEDDA